MNRKDQIASQIKQQNHFLINRNSSTLWNNTVTYFKFFMCGVQLYRYYFYL